MKRGTWETDETMNSSPKNFGSPPSGKHCIVPPHKRWVAGLCSLAACYMLFVVFAMYKLGESTTQLYEYPYTVSREVREMKVRLYEMKNSLPTLFATPDLSFLDIEEILKLQEHVQDASLERIRAKYRDDPQTLIDLEKALADLRQARRRAAWATREATEFVVANDYYTREILPYLETLDAVLNRVGDAADLRGESILSSMDRIRGLCIVITVLMGLFITWLIIFAAKLDRKKNRELAYREKLFNLLAANIDEVFFISRNEGNFEYVSSNSRRVIGVPAERLRRDSGRFYSLLAVGEREWLRAVFADRTLRGPVEREIQLTGNIRQYRIRIYPIYQDGILERYITVLTDQTDAVTYQQRLSDALESARNANAAKSAFLSHMSHEIRTPMNAIIGMTAIAMSKLGDQARVEDCLGKIGLSSRHLLGLINDVLDMSKIEGGKLAIAHESFNLQMSIQAISNIIQPQAEERGLNFEITIHEVEEVDLCGDALRLHQILINILSNAVKFTPSGGSIRLDICQLSKKSNSARFRFITRDTGIGMSQDFLKRLYIPFEQAESSSSSKYGGTGLGMAITQNLVALLGGTISVKSEEGRGSEFTVELPFGLSSCHSSAEVSRLAPLKVLVVDDDCDSCEHAALLLDKMGLSTKWVLSGEEAIQLVLQAHKQGEGYDVCLIDWKMPGIDGVETARSIRRELGPDTLIIVISAYDWGPIEQEAREAGVDAFIGKPFFASSLYNALFSLMRRVPKESAVEAAESSRNFSGKHILLVEDNELNREVAQEFIEMKGADVECATNGKEALEMFMRSEPGHYALILMDVQMPVMGGYEATRAIRSSAHADAKNIPILAMTANAFNEDISAAMEAGMNAHIAKPLDVAALYRLLEEHIAR